MNESDIQSLMDQATLDRCVRAREAPEWPQYMFSEDDAQAPSTCPITITRAHPKPAVQLP
ncbi:hypothetical protein [Natrinema sp. SYSU A 869]|uniref:hypothetical protein n=1 Tax=Natrinema sp. SYSU A 869 TaxID=2871694 RepID=UPI001CA41C51|nr:hypothetical protein [Natrinema sp. SYSU A 869]